MVYITGNCQDDCTPDFPDLDSASQSSASLTEQFVVPHYMFMCSTVITSWEAIINTEKQSSLIQFQAWRWNLNVSGYQIVGSNTFSRKYMDGVRQKAKRFVYTVQEPQQQIHVEPGDIVGVFAKDVKISYKSSDNVEVYAADVDSPLAGIFAPLNLDPSFNLKIHGVPLIAVQTGMSLLASPIGVENVPIAQYCMHNTGGYHHRQCCKYSTVIRECPVMIYVHSVYYMM